MTSKLLLVVLALGLQSVFAQEPEEYLSKVQSLDSTLTTLYAVISGEKGEARNWELFKYLFKPDAKLIPSNKDKSGIHQVGYLSPERYIEVAGNWLVENGFHEVEIKRSVQSFGSITQVFSTYESYKSKEDKEPFMRGINSIQLLNDGKRWWVINIYWQQESADNPIPKQYLPD